MNYPGYFAPQHALCTDEIENLRGSLRESMDLTKQYYDASINVARARDAALVRARDLETALEWYATPAIYECGTEDGHDCDAHACWGDIDEDQGNAARAALAATQEAAGAGEPNLLVIDTTNAQMVQMPNTTAAASSMPSSWRPASAPPARE